MNVDRADLLAEPTADDVDRAGSETDFAVREARRRQELQAEAEMPRPNEKGECLDCGEPVEPQRLLLKLGRCFGCAQARESRHGIHRRPGAR